MRDKEVQLNYDLLMNSKGIIPGETYELDPARKKQLETVARSITYSPTRMDTNYLAERGKTILHWIFHLIFIFCWFAGSKK